MDVELTEISAGYGLSVRTSGYSVRARALGAAGDTGVLAEAGFGQSSSLVFDTVEVRGVSFQLGAGRPREGARGVSWFPWAGVQAGSFHVVKGWGEVLAQDSYMTARSSAWGGPAVGLVGRAPLGRWVAVRTDAQWTLDHEWYVGNQNALFHELLGAWSTDLLVGVDLEWRPVEWLGATAGVAGGIGGWPFHSFGIGAGGSAGLVARL